MKLVSVTSESVSTEFTERLLQRWRIKKFKFKLQSSRQLLKVPLTNQLLSLDQKLQPALPLFTRPNSQNVWLRNIKLILVTLRNSLTFHLPTTLTIRALTVNYQLEALMVLLTSMTVKVQFWRSSLLKESMVHTRKKLNLHLNPLLRLTLVVDRWDN